MRSTVFVLIFLLTKVCFGDSDASKFLLPRIKSQQGDGSEVRVMLHAGRFARGEIYDRDAKGAKRDFIQEAPREMIILSNGSASLISKEQGALVISNEFLVDRSLDMTVRASWNGKKMVHCIC